MFSFLIDVVRNVERLSARKLQKLTTNVFNAYQSRDGVKKTRNICPSEKEIKCVCSLIQKIKVAVSEAPEQAARLKLPDSTDFHLLHVPPRNASNRKFCSQI